MAAKLQIHVAWDECGPDGMLHIVNFYRWMDRATHALMVAAGFGDRTILEKFGAAVPAVEVSARFMAPLTFGEVVVIETEITYWGKRSFHVEHRGYCRSYLAFAGMEARVWANIEDGKARSAVIPDAFREAVSELAGRRAV